MILPVEASIILKSAKNPDANTNDGTRGFAINPEAAKAIQEFNVQKWEVFLKEFLQGRTKLSEQTV